MAPPANNAFYFFMLDYEKKHGKKSGGLKVVAEKASPIWNSMGPADRKPYEEMASAAKGNRQKLTTHGETYEEVARRKRLLEEKQELMMATIKSTVDGLVKNNGLVYEPFYLIHMNYFCKTGDGVYYPAEIALSEFTVKRGMREPFHTFINPGPLPKGYQYKAQEHGSDTHRIDINLRLGESDMSNIVQEIAEYIGDIHNLPPLYTLEKFVPSIEAMLNSWAKTCDLPEDYFRVYPLEELFFLLQKASIKSMDQRQLSDGQTDRGFIFSTVAAKKLNDDPYNYRPHIACKMHDEMDVVQHCSRSYVTRWGWVMCDYICTNMGVNRMPGRHCPYNAAPSVQPIKPSKGKSQASASDVGRTQPSLSNAGRSVEAAMCDLSLSGPGHPGLSGFGRGIQAPAQAPALGQGAPLRSAGRGQCWNMPEAGAVGPGPAAYEDGLSFFPALASRKTNRDPRPVRQPKGNGVTWPAHSPN